MTKQTDYGIVLVTHLARQIDRPHSAAELASELQIPLPMVSKILKLLARDGLLVSHRGVRGGYALARTPERITVAEVIAALEGPIAMTDCADQSHADCTREAFCSVRGNWQLLDRVVREALAGITLADMAQPLPPRPARERGLVALGGRVAAAGN